MKLYIDWERLSSYLDRQIDKTEKDNNKSQMKFWRRVYGIMQDYADIEQEPKTEWIPVKDDMPIVGEEVLVCDLDGDMYISYLHTDGRWGFDYGGNKIKNVIAWCELPKPYSEVSE